MTVNRKLNRAYSDARRSGKKRISEMSWTKIRLSAERFRWLTPQGEWRTGFDVPKNAVQWERQPFYLRAVTKKGTLLEGEVTCISVNTRYHSRRVKFVASGEIREVYDILIIEIDGTRFFVH